MNDDTRAKLHQDLPANAVRTRDQAGAKLSYIDGHYVIERLNQVFGHDGWSDTYGVAILADMAGERAASVWPFDGDGAVS